MHRYWNNGLSRYDGDGFDGMMDFWNNNSGWYMIYDLVKFLIIIIAIIFIVRMLMKSLGNQKDRPVDSSSNRAIELLKERYAAGEIDEEEYQKRYQRLNEE